MAAKITASDTRRRLASVHSTGSSASRGLGSSFIDGSTRVPVPATQNARWGTVMTSPGCTG